VTDPGAPHAGAPAGGAPNPGAPGPWAEGPRPVERTHLRTALQQLTGMMVLAMLGLVVAMLVEPLARFAMTPNVPAARRGLGERVRTLGWSTAAPARHGPMRDGDDGPVPHGTLGVLEEMERQAGEPARRTPASVVTRSATALRDRAEDDGREVLRVPKGTRLRLVQTLGDWGLVMTSGPDGPVFGWVQRSAFSEP